MSRQANNATAHSPSRDLPSLPFSPGSTSATRPTTTVIDLSSPTKPLRSEVEHTWPTDTSRPRLSRTRRSDDERRLVGDFSTPADAVALPDPRSWFMKTADLRPGTMAKKPGSQASFKPVNTINDVNLGAGHTKQITYSKQHRQYPLSIGQTRHAGQRAYLARESIRASTTPTRKLTSRETLARSSSGGSSVKRRKTHHIINLSDDDDEDIVVSEVRDVSSPSATHTPAGMCHEVPSSIKSSQSQISVRSDGTTAENMPASQRESGFRAVDSVTNAHRKRARRPGSNSHQGMQRINSVGGGSAFVNSAMHTRTSAIEVLDSEVSHRAKCPRQVILQDFQQGTSASTSDNSEQTVHRHDTIVYNNFPNMRINESTAEQMTHGQHATSGATALHKLSRTGPRKTTNTEGSGSEDELSMTKVSDSISERPTLPSKSRRAVNNGVRKRVQPKANSKEPTRKWPLAFARTFGYADYRSKANNGRHDLVLQIDANGWRVIAFEHTAGICETKIEIKPCDFNKVYSDSAHRIRLQGPRHQNGNCSIIDLEFVETPDHQEFQDGYAKSLPSFGKVIIKSKETMVLLFSKPLLQNSKPSTSKLVHDSITEQHQHTEYANSSSKAPTTNRMNAITRSLNAKAASTEVDSVITTGKSTRPARFTRSLAMSQDPREERVSQEVQKFSIIVGLGTPWTRPLEFGQGRQRAVVHFDDLPRLDEEEFLNDSLIDFYMIYLFSKLNVPSDKVYFFNTYFFTQLTKNTGRQSMNYQAVERWTSKIDIFGYDYIVVPINEATHWYLAIICNVSKIDRKPVIEDLDDSFAGALEQSHEDLAEQTNNDEKKDDHVLHLTQPPNILSDAVEHGSDLEEVDPNLSDSEPNINLVDRDNNGAEEKLQANNQKLSISHPPAADLTRTAQNAFDAETLPKGILSTLTLSPERKKTKRKPTQPKKDPNQPIILILDSLGQTRSGTVRALKDWLSAEGEAKRGMEATIKEKGYYPKASQIPMQNNWTDCGVYLLGYVEKFFQNPDEFKNKLLTGEMSAKEDWPELKPGDMRTNMREIIFDLAREQNVTRKDQRRAKRGLKNTEPPPSPLKSEHNVSTSKQVLSGGTTRETGSADPMEAETPSLNELPLPKLASPFQLDLHHTKALSRSHTPEAVGKVSDSSPISTSPVRRVSISPRTRQTTRRRSPEVRIPVKTPQSIASSTRKWQAALITTTLPSNHVQFPGDHSALSSPLALHSRKGSAGQPITIDDSQDTMLKANQFAASQHTAVPDQTNISMRSPRRRQIIRHAPTVHEVPAASPGVAGETFRQLQEPVAGHEAEVNIDDEDQERTRFRRSRARSPTTYASHISMDPIEDAAYESMDVASDDVDVMDIDESVEDISIGKD
ncbi:hypothetical protein BKA66DRAFT_438349 [Pyrenochaeta sp. MPI-SDFR-AT-0127]|nr:hypothetical protein BKA66DRAFT_438349 [Pyrenochaeta sp. MPI-SDFR-AT-0127]